MSTFYSNYLTLCAKKGLSPSKVALEIGFSKGTVTQWKNGGTPSNPILLKIADYFSVSLDELLEPRKDGSVSGPKRPRLANSNDLFYKNFITLCGAKRISVGKAAEEIGLSKSVSDSWKNGISPSDATVGRVAAYFNIPIDSLLCEQLTGAELEQKEKPAENSEQSIIDVLNNMELDQLKKVAKYAQALVEAKETLE